MKSIYDLEVNISKEKWDKISLGDLVSFQGSTYRILSKEGTQSGEHWIKGDKQ